MEAAADVSFCVAEGRTILLDLMQNRYFCLTAEHDRRMRAAIAARRADSALADVLQAKSALSRGVGREPHVVQAQAPIPTTSALESKLPNAPAVLSATAAASQVRSMLALKYLSLDQIIASLRRRKASSVMQQRDWSRVEVARTLSAFRASAFLLSREDRCLPRSLALMRELSRRRTTASLVIGVKVSPFGAHAWVQDGEVVLNDFVDVARIYTPILVV